MDQKCSFQEVALVAFILLWQKLLKLKCLHSLYLGTLKEFNMERSKIKWDGLISLLPLLVLTMSEFQLKISLANKVMASR
jgi:hypothetical protein